MSEEASVLSFLREWSVAFLSGLLAIIGLQWKRLSQIERDVVPRGEIVQEFGDMHRKIDSTEKTLREQVTSTERQLRSEIHDGNKTTHERLDKILDKMADKH